MKSLVEALSFFKKKKKKCNVHSEDFLFFLCEFQNKGKLIPLHSFNFQFCSQSWSSCAVDDLFSHILEETVLFLSPPPSVGLFLS
jgi:hypothetical protein